MQEKFYSNKSALVLEYTQNGLFAVVAPLLKIENDIKYYDWDKKKTILLKVEECLTMAESLQKYIDHGSDYFHTFCQTIFRNPKYKNLVFVHDKSKRGGGKVLTSFGLQEYNGYMSFIVDVKDNNAMDQKISVSLDYPSIIKMKEFLKLIAWQDMRTVKPYKKED